MKYYDQLLDVFTPSDINEDGQFSMPFPDVMYNSLRSIVELHKPTKIPTWVPTSDKLACELCAGFYPCATIQAIVKELT